MKGIILVIVLMFSSMVGAITSKVRTMPNQSGYYVQIYNNKSTFITCTLTATNGKYYKFFISSNSYSGWYWINDPSARYVYRCRVLQ